MGQSGAVRELRVSDPSEEEVDPDFTIGRSEEDLWRSAEIFASPKAAGVRVDRGRS